MLVNNIDAVLKNDENYLLVFLKECKNIEKEKQVTQYITEHLKFSSDKCGESDG